jgi:hypothetical protein
VCTEPQELESLRRLYRSEKYILAQRGDTLKVRDQRSGLWVSRGEGQSRTQQGCSRLDVGAWRSVKVILSFKHFWLGVQQIAKDIRFL